MKIKFHGPKYFFNYHNIKFYFKNYRNFKFYFDLRRNKNLRKEKVSCIMCVWDEQSTIKLALESSKEFVDEYIIVDKNGSTIDFIEDYLINNDIQHKLFTKPDLNLQESRIFALKFCSFKWILIQDGDEIFRTTGRYSIHNLRKYMNYRNVVFCCPMVALSGDYVHVNPKRVLQPPHKFLYYNNGSIRIPSNQRDLPIMDGWQFMLNGVYKFNCCEVKPPKRIWLRTNFWYEWNKTNFSKKYRSLETYVKKEYPEINIKKEVTKWHKSHLDSLIEYETKKYGPLPQVILKHLNITNACDIRASAYEVDSQKS